MMGRMLNAPATPTHRNSCSVLKQYGSVIAGMMSQNRLNESRDVLGFLRTSALSSMLHRLLDIERNDPRKTVSPSMIDEALVKAPPAIKAATSPKGFIPPRIR